MLFEIDHRIEFSYSEAAFLDPHIIRLTPRSDATQTLSRFELEISPQPAGRNDCVDLDGNISINAWFNGTHDRLRLQASSTVRTSRNDPFDYLLTYPDTAHLPCRYPDALHAALEPYRAGDAEAAGVAAFAHSVAEEAGNDTLAFLLRLAAEIAGRSDWKTRIAGPPQPAEVTLTKARGACRDLVVLFNEACRSLGLAARFVSGYTAGDEGDPGEMHAWSEVYLPGGGWRGYDPSLGLAVADAHVAVAAAARASEAAPTSGAFRRTGATARLDYSVDVRCVEDGSRTA